MPRATPSNDSPDSTQAKRHIVLIGECMVEFSPQDDGRYVRGFAGDSFNTAWYLRKILGENWSVRYFTNIGDDQLSTDMCRFMAASGVDTTHVKAIPGKTAGLYVISLDRGERSFSYWRETSAARTLANDLPRLAAATEEADCVFFSGVTLAILPEPQRDHFLQHMAALRSRGVHVAFDPNIRKRLWSGDAETRLWIGRGYEVASLALPSFADDAEIFGDADISATAKRIRCAGVDEIAVKNGSDPCLVSLADQQHLVSAQSNTRVVDTTGAGDGFNAGYLSGRLLGLDVIASAKKAHALAAQVIAAHGALVPITGFDRG